MSDLNLDLCYMTATEAIAAFKTRALSPVELLKAIIARCEQLEPKVNALTYTYFDRALEQAKAAESQYARRGGQPRPPAAPARGRNRRDQGFSSGQG